MAKADAPFLSINASGTMFSLLTAAKWKGRPYLRGRVIPSNPRTEGQANTRFYLGTTAKGAAAVLTSYADSMHVGSPYFTAARDQAPSGQSWISFLQRYSVNDASAVGAAWGTLNGTKQGYFNTTGAAIGLSDYTPVGPADSAWPQPATAGFQLFVLAYFASVHLSGSIKTAADTAIAAASQGDVDDFGDLVHLTTP